VTAAARRALRLAHRGDWRAGPENGLDAMRAALRNPDCDGLEFDVRGSSDGVPVVIHDATLARVHGVDARVDDLTAAELGAHAIPSLAELLALVPPRAFLDVELKGKPVHAVVPVLEARRGSADGTLRRTVVSSFEADALRWLGAIRPAWALWLNVDADLSEATLALARDLGCSGISADWRLIDERAARRVAEAGLALAAWTVTTRATARRLDRLGVVAMCVEGAALDG
jgi:glycerophosphoryl diester phosphodiesterase